MVFAGDLFEYPEDVFRSACQQIRREHKFFPTISEMRDACEEKYEFRRALLNEIKNLMSGTKQLGSPDPRSQMHFRALWAKKDWLPIHYRQWAGDAEDMAKIMRDQNRETDAAWWKAEHERRAAAAQKFAS